MPHLQDGVMISEKAYIKMLAKSNKIELSEKFVAIWREEQTLCDVMSPLYQDKNEKDKSLKRISDKFQTFSG